MHAETGISRLPGRLPASSRPARSALAALTLAAAAWTAPWAAAEDASGPSLLPVSPDGDARAAQPVRGCGVVDGLSPPGGKPEGAPPCPFNDAGSKLYGYAADDGLMIDVMVVYTAAARDAAGSDAELVNRVNIAIAYAHQAYANSLIAPQLRLVHAQLVNYTETGQVLVDLARLADPDDGILDEVHALRDQHGADLVSLWVQNLDAGGAAYFLSGLGSNDDGRAGFSVCRQDNYPFETFAHELGHNFGCQHDRTTNPTGGFFNYSYGYREPGGVWKDIMSYPPGTTIQHFSNPDVNYNGPLGNPGPTGVPGNDPNASCNNALTINQTAWTIANFRPSTLPSAPPSRLYVRPSAPPGGNGASWATAMQDLQAAICTAVQSRGVVTEIWASAGTYKPNRGITDPLVARLIAFRPVEGVAIYGGFAGNETQLSQRDPVANPTILSGDIGVIGTDADNTLHVVDVRDLGPTAVLDGFIIRDGNANMAYPHNEGGGLRGLCSRATLRNCRFVDNRAETGGAVILEYGVNGPTFDSCRFEENSAIGGGGAVYCRDAEPIFTDCEFHMNTAEFGGAMVFFQGSAGTMTDCSFTFNESTNLGGAVAAYQSAPVFTGCQFSNNGSTYAGAFDCEDGSSPTLMDCDFDSNTSLNGAGAFAAAGPATMPMLSGCTFNGNSADGGGAVFFIFCASPQLTGCTFTMNTANAGAAAYHYDADPVYDACTFTLNAAGSAGAGIGGAIVNLAGAAPVIRGSLFDRNSAGCCAGAIWNSAAGAVRILNCRFHGNTAAYGGGAIYNSDNAAPQLVNAVFTGNRAPEGDGGAILNLTGAAGTCINCTLAGNVAQYTAGGIYTDGASPTLTNALLWQNTDAGGTTQASQITTSNGTAAINYCHIQGWTGTLGGTANFGADPLFRDADGPDNLFGTLDDDVRLAAASPAIDSGQNAAVPPDVASDAAGLPRFADAPCVVDTGAGMPPLVDRGAHEFHGVGFVLGDFNDDNQVTPADIPGFVAVLLGTDNDPAHLAAADMNCDTRADGRDVPGFTTLVLAP